MIFPTLEWLTAQEQEAFELEQLAARGCIGPAAPRGRNRKLTPDKVVDRMELGAEYRVTDIMKLCKVDYAFVERLVGRGIITRTGTCRHYRYSKAAT